MSATAFIGLGANLGDAPATLGWAWQALQGLGPARVSSLYRSAPLEAQGPDFFNAVVALHSAEPAEALLERLLALELQQGRERPYRNAPRTLDLDLLALGTEQRASERLQLPHPRLHERAFVLLPLLELAPELALPGLGALQAYLPAVAAQGIECLGDFERLTRLQTRR